MNARMVTRHSKARSIVSGIKKYLNRIILTCLVTTLTLLPGATCLTATPRTIVLIDLPMPIATGPNLDFKLLIAQREVPDPMPMAYPGSRPYLKQNFPTQTLPGTRQRSRPNSAKTPTIGFLSGKMSAIQESLTRRFSNQLELMSDGKEKFLNSW